MTPSQAEGFAVEVLGWLAEDHARIGAFLAGSGLSPGALREAVSEPAFLLAVLEFLMADEAMLLACCGALDAPATMPAAARAALPGGAEVHWT